MAKQLTMDEVKVHYNSKKRKEPAPPMSLNSYIDKVMNGPPPFVSLTRFTELFAQDNDIPVQIARLDPVVKRLYKKYQQDNHVLPDMKGKSTYVLRSQLVDAEIDYVAKARSREVQFANLLDQITSLLNEVADLRLKVALATNSN